MHPHGCWQDVVTLVTCYSMELYRLGFKQMSQGPKEGFLLSTVLGKCEPPRPAAPETALNTGG